MKHAVIDGERISGIYDNPYLYLACAEEVEPETHYYDGADIVPRPLFAGTWSKTTIVADGVDLTVLTGLSASATVWVTYPSGPGTPRLNVPVEGGVAQIGASVAGVYTVRAEDWPSQVYEEEITATEPTP